MSTPEVSVIIPAYNAERWLREAVDSVLAQTHNDWESIIVNDGSTDATLRIAYGIGDDRMIILDQVNAGVSAARNAGVTLARGKYICFMDADDVMLPTNLAVKVACLKEHGVDWVYGDLALRDAHMRPIGQVLRGTDNDVLETLLLNYEPAVPTSCSNVVARRSCFQQGVCFDEHLSNAADQDFSMQLAARFSHRHLPGVYNLYRIVPGSMSKNIALYERDRLRLFWKAREGGHLTTRSSAGSAWPTCIGQLEEAGGCWHTVLYGPSHSLPKRSLTGPRSWYAP